MCTAVIDKVFNIVVSRQLSPLAESAHTQSVGAVPLGRSTTDDYGFSSMEDCPRSSVPCQVRIFFKLCFETCESNASSPISILPCDFFVRGWRRFQRFMLLRQTFRGWKFALVCQRFFKQRIWTHWHTLTQYAALARHFRQHRALRAAVFTWRSIVSKWRQAHIFRGGTLLRMKTQV